jgi:hypothetical protein
MNREERKKLLEKVSYAYFELEVQDEKRPAYITIAATTYEAKGWFVYGAAVCSPEDRFSRRAGRYGTRLGNGQDAAMKKVLQLLAKGLDGELKFASKPRVPGALQRLAQFLKKFEPGPFVGIIQTKDFPRDFLFAAAAVKDALIEREHPSWPSRITGSIKQIKRGSSKTKPKVDPTPVIDEDDIPF